MQCNRCGAELYSTGSGLSGLCPTCDSFAKSVCGNPNVTITIDGKTVNAEIARLYAEIGRRDGIIARLECRVSPEGELQLARAENEQLKSDKADLQKRLANLIDGSEYERMVTLATEAVKTIDSILHCDIESENNDFDWAWGYLSQEDVQELLKEKK
jgi:hypothetical protein